MKNASIQNLLQTIKKIRITKGYSQEVMAYQLKISQTAYHKIETGKTDLKVTMLFQIIELLNINCQDIFLIKKVKDVA